MFADTSFSIGGGINRDFAIIEKGYDAHYGLSLSINPVIAGKFEFDINEDWILRTGLWLQRKSASFTYHEGLELGRVTIHTNYVSVPMNIQYQASESVGVFSGYIADFRLGDDCDYGGNLTSCILKGNSESIVHLATVGLSIKASEKINVDMSWQQGLSYVWRGIYKIHSLQVIGFYVF
jgi:hypothetical protein